MPSERWPDDDFDDLHDDPDWDSPEQDVEDDFQSCPECGADIYADSEQCPICHNYITWSHSGWSGRSKSSRAWGTWAAIAALVAILAPTLLGFAAVAAGLTGAVNGTSAWSVASSWPPRGADRRTKPIARLVGF